MSAVNPLDELLDQVADRLAERLAKKLQQPTRHHRRLLTVKEAAAYLGRSAPSIHRLAASGALPSIRADRRLFFDINDLDHWISSHRM